MIPRWKRLKRRDWKEPFSWFEWAMRRKKEGVLFRYEAGRTWQNQTFSRADASTCATYVDANGVVRLAAANVIRDAHYINGVRTTLLEGSRQNLVVQSEALGTTWSAAGGAVATNGAATSNGLTFTRLSSLGAGGVVLQVVGFTGDGTKAISYFIKQDAAVTGTHVVSLYDNTAATTRGSITATIAAGGAITFAVGGGATLLRSMNLGNGVYWVGASIAGVVAANTNRFYAVDSGTATSVLLAGCQAENAAFPSSYIPTTTAAVTRAADSLSFPFLVPPMAMTVYAKAVDGGELATADDAGIVGIGSTTNEAFFIANNAGGKYRSFHIGNANVNSTAATAPVLGDTIEVRAVLFGDGSTQFGQTINGAAEAVAAQSAAQAGAGTFSAQTICIGKRSSGGFEWYGAFQSIKVASGVQTLATMRAL